MSANYTEDSREFKRLALSAAGLGEMGWNTAEIVGIRLKGLEYG
jgi:hypothetical protein